RQARWRLADLSTTADTDYDAQHQLRMTVLEVLYGKRRLEPPEPGGFHIDIEKLTRRPREHLRVTLWDLVQKKLVQRPDNALLGIPADGIDYLEERQRAAPHTRRLRAVNE